MPPEQVRGISVAAAVGLTTGVGQWQTWGGVGGKGGGGGGGRGGGVIPLLPSVVINQSVAVLLAREVMPQSMMGWVGTVALALALTEIRVV